MALLNLSTVHLFYFSLVSAFSYIFSLDLVFCCFSGHLRLRIRSLIFARASLMYVFKVINFPPSTALVATHKLWFVAFSFLFSSRLFLISTRVSSLIHGLFQIILFKFSTPGVENFVTRVWFNCTLVREHIQYYVSHLESAETCFTVQHMHYVYILLVS